MEYAFLVDWKNCTAKEKPFMVIVLHSSIFCMNDINIIMDDFTRRISGTRHK